MSNSNNQRYKLRSSAKGDKEPNPGPSDAMDSESSSRSCSTRHSSDTSQPPPEKKARMTVCRRKLAKSHHQSIKNKCSKNIINTSILELGVDPILHLAQYLDASSLISLYQLSSAHTDWSLNKNSQRLRPGPQPPPAADGTCSAGPRSAASLNTLQPSHWLLPR